MHLRLDILLSAFSLSWVLGVTPAPDFPKHFHLDKAFDDAVLSLAKRSVGPFVLFFGGGGDFFVFGSFFGQWYIRETCVGPCVVGPCAVGPFA